VIKGTWYTGTGETFDVDKAVPLTAGSYMFHPAKAVHWDGAKDEEVIVQMCVQRRLACSAGDKPAGAKVRAP
jgi:hypothetical protein